MRTHLTTLAISLLLAIVLYQYAQSSTGPVDGTFGPFRIVAALLLFLPLIIGILLGAGWGEGGTHGPAFFIPLWIECYLVTWALVVSMAAAIRTAGQGDD